jgi:hypothetical protein
MVKVKVLIVARGWWLVAGNKWLGKWLVEYLKVY